VEELFFGFFGFLLEMSSNRTKYIPYFRTVGKSYPFGGLRHFKEYPLELAIAKRVSGYETWS